MSIQFSSALSDIIEINPSFDAAKLRVAYTGKNRNNTFISKETFERAIPTMFNVPVVANYMRDKDEIGSHDGEWVKDENGDSKYVMITQPVGVVPESAQWYWEDVSDNGVMHQYFCTEVVLWKRQEAYQKIKDNGVTSHSMEIEVTDGKMLDDYYNIKDFNYTAFCLLGSAKPCFESSALFTFSDEEQENFKLEYTQMLKELKELGGSFSEEDKEANLKLKELLEQYSVSIEDVTFDTDGLSDEELEAKFAEMFDGESDGEGADDPAADDPVADDPAADDASAEDDQTEDPAPADDEGDDIDYDNEEDGGEGETSIKKPEEFVLDSQMRDTLYAAVRDIASLEDDWGAYPRYFVADYDAEASEVYFIDMADGKLYGCGYTFDGDDIVIDAENIVRKKYEIVDYVEGSGEQMFAFDGLFEAFKNAYVADPIDADEFKRLQDFEASTLKAAREAEESKLFAEFEDQLKENDNFTDLKEHASDYTIEELRKELFALVGQMNFAAKNDKKFAPGIIFEDKPKNSSMRKLFAWKDNE